MMKKKQEIEEIRIHKGGRVYVKWASIVEENGVEIARGFNGREFDVDEDMGILPADELARVQAICDAAWTPEIRAARAAAIAAEQAPDPADERPATPEPQN